jgi:hypothetical protein
LPDFVFAGYDVGCLLAEYAHYSVVPFASMLTDAMLPNSEAACRDLLRVREDVLRADADVERGGNGATSR